MSVNSFLRRATHGTGQEDCEFEASLGYIVNSETLSQKNQGLEI
jgi:hypothetical protein